MWASVSHLHIFQRSRICLCVSPSLPPTVDYVPAAANMTFVNWASVYRQYTGDVIITPPAAEANVSHYALYFAAVACITPANCVTSLQVRRCCAYVCAFVA